MPLDLVNPEVSSVFAELNHLMTIPVSYWAASTCGVVVFLKFGRIRAARPAPLALQVTYSRTSGEWVPHKSFFGTSFSFDPIADPDHRRDLDGRLMVTGASSRVAGQPPPGIPAAILTGRAAPEVAHIALIQDGHEVRRQLDSHFGAWVVCTERPGPFQVAGLDSHGTVLATIDHTPDLDHPSDLEGSDSLVMLGGFGLDVSEMAMLTGRRQPGFRVIAVDYRTVPGWPRPQATPSSGCTPAAGTRPAMSASGLGRR